MNSTQHTTANHLTEATGLRLTPRPTVAAKGSLSGNVSPPLHNDGRLEADHFYFQDLGTYQTFTASKVYGLTEQQGLSISVQKTAAGPIVRMRFVLDGASLPIFDLELLALEWHHPDFIEASMNFMFVTPAGTPHRVTECKVVLDARESTPAVGAVDQGVLMAATPDLNPRQGVLEGTVTPEIYPGHGNMRGNQFAELEFPDGIRYRGMEDIDPTEDDAQGASVHISSGDEGSIRVAAPFYCYGSFSPATAQFHQLKWIPAAGYCSAIFDCNLVVNGQHTNVHITQFLVYRGEPAGK
ncbi:hypothetical protein [Pseudomonas xanthosomatis]|uniref:hypothetical protein n=1 Tax=Pseudomonas xanthosomatis TaxID=2842356 RepID=UPI003514096B